MAITISKLETGFYSLSFEYYYNDSKELYRSFYQHDPDLVSKFEKAEYYLNKYGQYLLSDIHFDKETLTEEEVNGFKSLYNNWFLSKHPDVILIRPMNEVAIEFYTNHSTYHDGDSGLDLFCLEDQEITRSNIQSVLDSGFIHPGIFGTIDVKAGEHDFNIPLHPAKIVDGRIEYFYP